MATNDHEQEDAPRGSGQVTRRWGSLAEALHRRLGPGASLEPTTRAAFEGRLGSDLSAAMVHRSPLAGRLARSLGAQAVSAGEHVLGDYQLDPSTPDGASLLGHELMHVVQRDLDATGEAEAHIVERALATEAHAAQGSSTGIGGGDGAVDADALTERVYQRLMDQVRIERDRGAWIS